MNWKPLQNYVVLLPDKEAEKTEGGIIIPQAFREYLNEGTLIASGPECIHGLANGARIVFTKHSEYRLKGEKGDKDFIVVQETNMMLYKLATKEKESKNLHVFQPDQTEELCKVCGHGKDHRFHIIPHDS